VSRELSFSCDVSQRARKIVGLASVSTEVAEWCYLTPAAFASLRLDSFSEAYVGRKQSQNARGGIPDEYQ